jgi:hypothetical protein
MIVMDKQGEIPCAACHSWRKKQKKFSCNPDSCSALTTWLFENAPHIRAETLQTQVHLPEVAFQYVV